MLLFSSWEENKSATRFQLTWMQPQWNFRLIYFPFHHKRSAGHHTSLAYTPSLWPKSWLSNSIYLWPCGERAWKVSRSRELEDILANTLMLFPPSGTHLSLPSFTQRVSIGNRIRKVIAKSKEVCYPAALASLDGKEGSFVEKLPDGFPPSIDIYLYSCRSIRIGDVYMYVYYVYMYYMYLTGALHLHYFTNPDIFPPEIERQWGEERYGDTSALLHDSCSFCFAWYSHVVVMDSNPRPHVW